MSVSARIVVGVDGSRASIAAVEIALREAGLRDTQVLAVACWPSEDRTDDVGPLLCETHEQATELLDHAIAEATHRRLRHAPLIREVTLGFAGPTLVSASSTADLLVIGATGHGGPDREGRGRTVVDHCLRHAVCPVLVVPAAAATPAAYDLTAELDPSSVSR